jgi:hypothetical protein
MPEFADHCRDLAAFVSDVLLSRGRRCLSRPADHGCVLNVDEFLGIELLEPEDGLVGVSVPPNFHAVVDIVSLGQLGVVVIGRVIIGDLVAALAALAIRT